MRRMVLGLAIVAICLLCWSTGSAQQKVRTDKEYIAAQVALVAAATTDVYSTVRPDMNKFKELNPVIGRQKWRQVAVVGGLTAFTLWGCRKIKRDGHPRIAKILLWATTAIHFAAAAHNFRLKEKP